jgi:hypothetical protein
MDSDDIVNCNAGNLQLNVKQHRAVNSIINYVSSIKTSTVNSKISTNQLNNKESPTDDLVIDDLVVGGCGKKLDAKPVDLSYPYEITEKHNFLLLGPGGSGKTTVITNAFNSNKYRIAFCAFTNKATQVLKKISQKFGIQFTADFMTIHKLLALEIRYLDHETTVAFDFSDKKIDHLKNYSIIIFDECSTISKELFGYIQQAWSYIYFKYGTSIKFIFLGDYWQLPPVGEDLSVIFKNASKEKWNVSKLDKVMRSGNNKMYDINTRLLLWVDAFKKNIKIPIDGFIRKYPYNLVMRTTYPLMYISHLDEFLDKYLSVWKGDKNNNIVGDNDTVILTYSRSNCQKTNFAIQDLLDMAADREMPEERKLCKFYTGDRCCLDRPIEVYTIEKNLLGNDSYVSLNKSTGESLYNGEIFDITATEDVKITTPLNKLKYIETYFDGQIITICRINDPNLKNYKILHIPEHTINKARKLIKSKTRRIFYLTLLSAYIKIYPKLEYGYCITVYKSQGSEWRNVLVNLNSIKWCIIGPSDNSELKKKKKLFRTTYTALSRASHNMWLFWGMRY